MRRRPITGGASRTQKRTSRRCYGRRAAVAVGRFGGAIQTRKAMSPDRVIGLEGVQVCIVDQIEHLQPLGRPRVFGHHGGSADSAPDRITAAAAAPNCSMPRPAVIIGGSQIEQQRDPHR